MGKPATTDPIGGGDASLFDELEHYAAGWATAIGERLAARARDTLHVEYKGGGRANPVSEADREAEQFLLREVGKRFPEHRVLGEEGCDPGPAGAPLVWVVDPLDGTTNYLNGLALWCVSIGVLWHGVPVAAAIWSPLGLDGQPALFSAHKGSGTRLNGRAVMVNPAPSLDGPRLAGLPEPYQAEIMRRRTFRDAGDVRTLGSIALELALTACGALQFSAFWMPRIWDVAGGIALVREAGGTVLRRETRDRPYTPLHALDAPGAEPLRSWRGQIIGANAALAAELADRVQHGRDLYTGAQTGVASTIAPIGAQARLPML